jgi:transposase
MEYSIEEKVYLTSWAITFTCEESLRLFREKYGRDPPSSRTVLNWKNKLLETGNLVNHRPRSGRPVSASGDEISQQIVDAVTENPATSTRTIAQHVGVSDFTVRKVLNNKNYHPYKPLYNQLLCDGDDDRRLQFCEHMKERFNRDLAFIRKLAFSDECVFSLTGNVNKHNVHYWATENPFVRISNPGKTATVTMWACIGYSGLLLHSFTDLTMNAERYCQILQEQVVPYFNKGIGKTMLYQQDGASPHYSKTAREILDSRLSGRWIGRRGSIEWPARSPDLTPCDFWFWSHLRQLVYPPGFIYNNVRELQTSIECNINRIPLENYRNSFRDFIKRVQVCISKEGDIFEE